MNMYSHFVGDEFMKLSLGKKIIGGYLLVTVFTAILGLVGIYSINALSNSTNDLVDETLPSVTAILKIDSELEQMAVELRDLQTADLSDTEYAEINNNLTKIRGLYEQDMDEFTKHVVPGTKTAQLFDEYKVALSEWKNNNEKYESLRKELQMLDLGNPDHLRTDLEIFRGDHYKRQYDVQNMLTNGEEFEGGERDDQCNFGKWLINTKTNNANLNSAIETVKVTHKNFHDLIAQCKKEYKDGDKEKAIETANQLNVMINQFIDNVHLIRTEIVKGQDLLEEMHILFEKTCIPKQKAANSFVAKIVENELQHAQEQGNETKQTASFSTNFILIATGVIAILAIGFGLLLSTNITRPIFRVIDELNNSADQVDDAAVQVSSSSQQLAQGATEQAAGLEETSASIQDMAIMVKQNAENTQQANLLSSDTTKSAKNGTESMRRMNEAIGKIQASSEETSKIIKVIDEIAFQTNLLALNAAVEAARAGEAGKGFAVVAEEVRNLAMRSAEAARNTSYMIEESVGNANNGVEICKEVDKNLSEITESVEKVSGLLSEVDASCQEQTQSIGQISRSMVQMDRITQANAASAEEGASAAEELSAQAEQMKAVVANMMANISGTETMATTNTETMAPRREYGAMNIADGVYHEIAKKSPEQIELENSFV